MHWICVYVTIACARSVHASGLLRALNFAESRPLDVNATVRVRARIKKSIFSFAEKIIIDYCYNFPGFFYLVRAKAVKA